MKRARRADSVAGRQERDPLLIRVRTSGNRSEPPVLDLPGADHIGARGPTDAGRFGRDLSRVPVSGLALPRLQPKLRMTSVGDAYEQEADRVSNLITGMPTPTAPSSCPCAGECSGCLSEAPAKPLQSGTVPASDLAQAALPSIVHEVLQSSGQALDPASRARMEPRFGQDFADVRIHTNERAAASADAMNARAYAFGHQIVFGAGEPGPGSPAGQRLLAHELTHVVQQGGGQTARGHPAGRPGVSVAMPAVMRQQKPSTDEQQRDEAVRKHVAAQKVVKDVLDHGRTLRPRPTAKPEDPDNLLRNSVGMLDAGKFALTVFSPTHYAADRYFDVRFKFDSKGSPQIGGTYPANPMVVGPGLFYDVDHNPDTAGRLVPPKAPLTQPIQTLPPKVEEPLGTRPGEVRPAPAKSGTAAPKPTSQPAAPQPLAPSDIHIYTRGLAISESDVKNTFVHEVQHLADMHTVGRPGSGGTDAIAGYKSEFRAFWIQPPPPPSVLAKPPIDLLPEPTGKASNSGAVTIADPSKCTACPPIAPSTAPGGKPFVASKTAMKNARQEVIFQHIFARYPQYACCYVFDRQFHDAVNQFAFPESVNLINSDRLMNLNLAMRMLQWSMTGAEVGATEFVTLLPTLEPLDWAYLKDPRYAKPFWDALTGSAPPSLVKGVRGLVDRGAKKPVSADDVRGALAGK